MFRSTEQYEKRKAQKAPQKAEGKVAEGQWESPVVHRTKFEALIEDLRRDYELKGRKTWPRRLQHLIHLRKAFQNMRAKAITTDRLQEYVSRRPCEGASNATIHRALDCLYRTLVLGTRHMPPKVGKIPHFPRLHEDNVREGYFEHDEFLALRGAVPDHIKVAMTIAYYTAMRKGEIIGANGLRWDQINLEEGSIRLVSRQTKTKEPRVIYMASDFLLVMMKAKELRDWNYPHCPYVCHMNGKPITNFEHGWDAACKRVGLEGRAFHDLRRTGVRNLIRAGVPETVAMQISGHKTRSVFDRYNITSERDLKQAATKLSDYIQEQKVTFPVTASQLSELLAKEPVMQPVEKIGGEGGDLKSRVVRTHALPLGGHAPWRLRYAPVTP